MEFRGGGLGGGDVRLFPLRRPSVTRPLDGDDDPDSAQYLDVKKNEWMLVSGSFEFQYPYEYPVGTLNEPTIPIGVHKWYRIVAAGEMLSEDVDESGTLDPGEDLNANGLIDWYRDVTMDGPDWNLRWAKDFNGDLVFNEAFATLLSGVVGVYSATIEF